MATDLNSVTIIGRLAREPELRYTPTGKAVARFSVAVNRTYIKDNERKDSASFFNCIAWGKKGEAIMQYVKKGHRISIRGRLQQRSWKDSDGQNRSIVEIVAEEFQFLQPKKEASSMPVSGFDDAQDIADMITEEESTFGDDLPF